MIGKASTFLGPNGLYRGSGATPSLVLSLDSNILLSYDGTSSTWYDLSVRKNNGLLNNVTSVTGSIPNTSFSFNGTSSFISFTQSNGIPINNSEYTIETWFNSNSYGPFEQGPLVGWGTLDVTDATNVFRLNGNGLYNYWWGDDLNIPFTGTSSMIVGNWYYAVATFDGAYRKIYLNGELKATDIPTGVHSVTDSSTLKIGLFYDNYFNGKISKVKISDKALSGSKILSSFNTDKLLHGYEFGSMKFNDTQSPYLISTSNDYVFGINDFTIEAFFKLSISNYGYTGVISQRHLGQFQPSINIQQSSTSTPLIEFCSGGGWLTFSASNDTWYHTAISRTGGTTSYYVNGDLFNEVSDTTNYTDDTLVVGRYYIEADDYYFNGVISNVRVVNGSGLYSGDTITVPTVSLHSVTNTKFLINSQKTTPSADLSGLLNSVTASNIGWTASLPIFYQYYYPDFSDTTGLELVSTYQIVGNQIYLTDTTTYYDVGNVYTSTAIRYDRSFSLNWNFYCGGGDGADGFCVQWTTTNNSSGGQGGSVGTLLDYSTINAFQFRTYGGGGMYWIQNGSQTSLQTLSLSLRQNVYYWMDYNHATSTINIYYSTSNTKPGSAQHTFTGVTFDSSNYYLGFGAATGGSNDYHILKSMNLTF